MKDYAEELDAEFSTYIRLRDTDSDFFGECCTCGSRFDWDRLSCGHFHVRAKWATRYYELNCFAQCHACNAGSHKDNEYEQFLARRYGTDFLFWLSRLSNQVFKKPQDWYVENIEHYKSANEKVRVPLYCFTRSQSIFCASV
jgi:hypothetical protein